MKTRSAQTPFGTQIVRELNIDEAVAASQGSTAMHRVQHTGSRALSMDCGVVSGVGSEGGRGAIGIFPAPYHLRRQSLISTGPEERTSRNVSIIIIIIIIICPACDHTCCKYYTCMYIMCPQD